MEIINCKLFLIPKPTKKHLYLFLFLFGSLMSILIPTEILKIDEKDINEENIQLKKQLTQKYFEIINSILSSLLMGIPHFINRIRNKDEYKNIQQQTYKTNSQKIDFINNNDNKEENRNLIMIKIIFIISFVDIICQLLIPIKFIIEDKLFHEIKYKDRTHLFFLLLFDIFARYLFSRWILKTYFYIHHKLSFILTIIGLIPISYVDLFKKIKLNNYYNSFYVIIVAIMYILYSFEDIMNKVAFRALSILPYTLIFYNGLFMLGYFVIISIFFFLFGLYDFQNDFDIFFVLKYSLCFLPFYILRDYYLIKVIDTFSAQYMALLRVAESIVIFGYYHPKGKEKSFGLNSYDYLLQWIGFFFLLISTLIHNEIIIINHPKLKQKTKYYLDKDADREHSSINRDTFFSDSLTDYSLTNLNDDLTGSDIS